MFVLAGLLSAVLARCILGLVGQAGSMVIIVLVAPVVEEVAKTGSALLLDTDIFLAHMVFGGAELVSDFLNRRSLWPGLVALVLHSILGIATAWLLGYVGVTIAVALVVLLHGLWNYTTVRLL
ncbi:hypothetical protein SPSYN_00561 [Sporotomaculum syntrophicum]|uniref:Uncharacterized protein n=1 Tax=Sporotomaculum syntrophicum TaxID=182264 RepID=A0A9D2WQM0_9FIRM|nr:hypothetical protein [Sporotomaculum syntrophicum]KAF1085832.1 hypothetical protein SPSYN_00561 [Sporotomaculum syntrophicum]